MSTEPDPILVVPYRVTWPHRFASHAALIRRALDDRALRVDHVGSTAVPGLAAKPVIDIQVSIRAFDPLDLYLEPLVSIGYVYRPDDDPFHRFFRNRQVRRRVHVHVREAGGVWERRHMVFRDYLRAHAQIADEYGRLKELLAVRFRDDRPGYVDGKAPFIERVLHNAEHWATEVGWSLDALAAGFGPG